MNFSHVVGFFLFVLFFLGSVGVGGGGAFL